MDDEEAWVREAMQQLIPPSQRLNEALDEDPDLKRAVQLVRQQFGGTIQGLDDQPLSR
jgi:hypothetical protein